MSDNNLPYLTVSEIAIKYNCSQNRVRKYALRKGVPHTIDKTNHKLYTFTADHEREFADRDKKTGKRKNHPTYCIIQHPKEGEAILHAFRSNYRAAFNFLLKTAPVKRYFINSYRYTKDTKYLSRAELEQCEKLVSQTDFIGPLIVYKPDMSSLTVFKDQGKPKDCLELIEAVFSTNQKRITIAQQAQYERAEDFCQRLFNEDAGEGQIALSEIQKILLPKP